MEFLNVAIVVLYLISMLAFGWWGKSRTKNTSDYLVAGRRLGPVLYTGTMAAVVLGGASTVGGVGLGYQFVSPACGLSSPSVPAYWCSAFSSLRPSRS